jgi:hypothetical protein
MQNMKRKRSTRPAVLIRFYGDDLKRLSRAAARACTPREAYARRAILEQLDKAEAEAANEQRAIA